MPPQHGKSHGASHLLPAYLLGVDPELRICIGSYSFSLARRFGLAVQRLIDSAMYGRIFEGTRLKSTPASGTALRTADEFDILNHDGGLRLVGREGSLTGSRVDIMILDDIYKDAAQAYSPLIRDSVWEWYCSVVRTRLHNNSKEIIVCTRWHKDDLIGRLLETEPEKWTVINFPALKVGKPTPQDPRKAGEALWEERHSKELLKERRALDPIIFEALYQGNPTPSEGLLYGTFATYKQIEEQVVVNGAYIDTADSGQDYLCAIFYAAAKSGKIYITDVLYTTREMEYTEAETAQKIAANKTEIAYIESNNGGRGFARAVGRKAKCRIITFHQSANKIARISSNSTTVMATIVMPADWEKRWGEFAYAITSFRRDIAANAHDAAADAITGVIEKQCDRSKKIAAITFH